ncbi:calcineurin-like phosphoesterase C-terminal domain-containing protein [Sphingobacterium faecale]|uniref:Calcineurin-like phosphoesterase family protein n=1 Tax=Sphingobacterium faecale TaxID=2803775 RepID=A0ABS1R3Q0_9SPHI|nr:calcineurin-like phosphoesterase family protein [Sphingobacterium faecale]MBL1409339.1 calcineurin-like phosphoesterase family protein [Sphingobacterium faecale]
MNIRILVTSALLGLGTVQAQELVKGTVFIDANRNGTRERNEKGVSGVSVSNGREVVQTDKSGNYVLPVQNDNIIFVIKPEGFSFPVDEYNHPVFYYIHKPLGSPNLKYPASSATGTLPKSLDFPVYYQTESKTFKALIFGDPQAYTKEELGFFKRGVIDDISNKESIQFGISLGDLVGDDLSLHIPYKQTVGSIGVPWHNVMGNHDMNYDVSADSLSDESFEMAFGPNNYSFNYGNAHFIVLDNIIYPNPRTGKGYLGGFRKDQLDFVENDLKFVSKDKLIVLAFHIPLYHENSNVFRNEDRQRLFDILKDYPNTVSLSAHTHYQQQNFYGRKDGWSQDKPHHEYNVGTTSGDWYSGVLNKQGVPVSTMRDGTPKGYAILNVNDNMYSFDYKVAGETPAYQIKVIAPNAIEAKHAKRYKVYANFFMGRSEDVVEYSLDGNEWKKMNYVQKPDPSYVYEVLKFDNATGLLEGRRPSDAVNSSHLWEFKLPGLKPGNYQIKIRTKDMYGKQHDAMKELEVIK